MPNVLYDLIEYANCKKLADKFYLINDNNDCGSLE